MVLDYQMPEMSGIELGEHLQNTPIQKILLTGNACDLKAIESFNHNIIQKYIQKGSNNTRYNLLAYIKELSIIFFSNFTKPLLNYLETERKTPLSDPVFIDFFENFCEKNDISEFYLIDINGSFLCITHQATQFILVVHTEASLKEWVSLYKNNADFPDSHMNLILNGVKIPFFGIGKEVWQLPTF